MVRRCSGLFPLILLPTLLTYTPPAAAFARTQLKCREPISKLGAKLAKSAANSLSRCQTERIRGNRGAATDCNNLAEADPKGKFLTLSAKLESTAAAKCAELQPSVLDYTGCPDPCSLAVPAISSIQDAVGCIVCLVGYDTEAVSLNGQGLPSVPLEGNAGKCHDAIGAAQTKLLTTLITERTKCQRAAERDGATDSASCVQADPKGKILSMETKARAALDNSCDEADLTALDACSAFSLTNLKNCVVDEATARGGQIFQSFYRLAAGGGLTTTTFNESSTTTMTTTTTIPGGGGLLCSLIFRVTTSDSLGALKYEVDYSAAAGEFADSGLNVDCVSRVSNGSTSFFDDDADRRLRQSTISFNGFANPSDVAECGFSTDGVVPTTDQFAITVLDAAKPDLQPAIATVVVASIGCSAN